MKEEETEIKTILLDDSLSICEQADKILEVIAQTKKEIIEECKMSLPKEIDYPVEERLVKYCSCKEFKTVCTYNLGDYDKKIYCSFCGRKLKTKTHHHKYAINETDMCNKILKEILANFPTN